MAGSEDGEVLMGVDEAGLAWLGFAPVQRIIFTLAHSL